MFPLAHQCRDAKQQLRALFGWSGTPRFEGLVSSFNRAVRQLFGCFLKTPHNLCAIGGIDAVKFVFSRKALTANHERILAPQLSLDLLNRGPHRDGIFFPREISQWFIAKFSWHVKLR